MPPQPRTAVCAGGLDFRLDAELLAAVAEALPAWRFLLAGRVHPTLDRRLERPANVQLAGSLPAEAIPRFLAAASVCLLPYRADSYGDALFPIKLVEYLAAGRPVVGTPIQAMKAFSDVVDVAGDADGFAAAIERTAAEDDVAKRRRRRERVGEYSWDARMDQMQHAIEMALGDG